MMRRLAVLVVFGLLVAGLFSLDEPHSVAVPSPSPVVGVAVDETSRSSTWYCPAGGDDATGLAHQIVITSLGRTVTAQVTGYGTETGSAVSVVETVAANSQHVVSVGDIGAALGGVTVEIEGGAATVAHRLVGANVEDQSDCSDEASDRWYFASAETELIGEVESVARLWLLNPFPTDASVDVRVTFDNNVRIPPKLRGVIVPAGSARVVELNEPVPRLAQFAFSVEARGGRVVAELAQTVNGRGLRLEPGVAAPSPSWLLADSFGGANLSERLVVFNPSPDDTAVSVSVIPNATDVASFPEPFLLDVPARRFQVLDLSIETRIPPEGLRFIRVDAADGPGVVVSQVEAITGAGGDGSTALRPSVAGGLASSSGSSAQATEWYLTSLSASTDSQSVVVVANPSADAISVVTLTAVTGGERSVIAEDLEVPPLQSLSIDVSGATGAGPIGVRVSSSTPVVVAGRTTSTARAELSMFPALPEITSASVLPAPEE